jgi:zinc transporter ZupT
LDMQTLIALGAVAAVIVLLVVVVAIAVAEPLGAVIAFVLLGIFLGRSMRRRERK